MRAQAAPKVIETFLIIQFACQLALLFPYGGASRILVRTAAFGTSLLLALLFFPRGRTHPALKPAMWAVLIVGLSIFNPSTNSVIAGAAQFAMYVAILAPLLWVSRLRLDRVTIRRVLLIVFVFQFASAATGVLQVYFPGHFRGNISSVVIGKGRGVVSQLYYRNAFGQMVMRPTGLSDVPGGAAEAGQFAALVGLYLLATERRKLMIVLAAAGFIVGGTAIYMSGLKSSMLVLCGCTIAFLTLLMRRSAKSRGSISHQFVLNRGTRLAAVTTLALSLATGGYFIALKVGGQGVTGSVNQLTDTTPGEVFYRERGHFLEYTVNVLLPEYPLGAGLGRWGMMSYYFGRENPDSPPIWAEIQWTGWLLDGGVLLMISYLIAVCVALRFALRCALSRSFTDLAVFGALVAAFDLGIVASTFNYIPFIGQAGMDFWLLNAMLFGAVVIVERKARMAVSSI
jgi:hypothetical protein